MEKLLDIKNKYEAVINSRINYSGNIANDNEILVHCNTGHKDHEQVLINNINQILIKNNLDTSVVKTGCFAMFNVGVVIAMYPSGVIYKDVQNTNLEELLYSHFVKKEVYAKSLYKLNDGTICKTRKDYPFFNNQKLVVSKNVGIINCESIHEYIATGGYFAANATIIKKQAKDIIDELKISGLRGRGGAGFFTYLKWKFACEAKSAVKYVVCNADEGDPGAFMNRAVLEGDPHSIIEGMIIAAKTINSNKGFIYVRNEYPLATAMLKRAILEAKKLNILGKNIFGSSFNFDIEIKSGAGAYVCGEETALINSIEGRRGEAKPKPPFPTTAGLFNNPTIINNVETLSIIPQIIKNGGSWYKEFGSENSRGTKMFALSGNVTNTGIVEVELGTKLRDIIYNIGGGIANNKKLKLVQLGGPSGGCLPEHLLDLPVDYDSFIKHGASMGSGSLIVVDNTTCVVEFAKFFVKFNVEESCGKCTPCRVGNVRVLEILEKISKMQGTLADLDVLTNLCEHISTTSLCGLGQTSTNIVKSTLLHFKDEYLQHINNKICKTKQCNKNFILTITDKCTKCGLCFAACPQNTIIEEQAKYTIIQEDCIKCMKCFKACPHNAIITK
ncbi:MAG: NADH-ubiquinone oxidoreductase-F iron-sulfur binding region domain-containing protein [Clostridia bacterium]|nr:NADH-ubiquinone oxidoreductase-F iron-sulfur binding region domain-containing protein [Clostridia bacterium]